MPLTFDCNQVLRLVALVEYLCTASILMLILPRQCDVQLTTGAKKSLLIASDIQQTGKHDSPWVKQRMAQCTKEH